MFLERHGNGPRTFLGLHGWSGSHRTFDPLLENLNSEISFFSADLPGCGRSEPPSPFTLNSVTSQLEAAIRTLPRPFTLIGNCSGALLGLLLAKRRPQEMERLLLIDLFAAMPWYFRIFLTPALGPVAYYSTFANPIGRWITNASLRNRRTPETTLTGGFARSDHHATYRYLRLFERFPPPADFSGLHMPIDLVSGARTFAAVSQSVPVWQSVWPQARSWRLEGAGHLPILEATHQLREILFSCPVPTAAL